MFKQNLTRLAYFALISAIWFGIGWTARGIAHPQNAAPLPAEAERILKAGQLILNRYYSDHAIDPNELANAAIRGMVRYTEDRYAGLITAPILERFQADFAGETGGSGFAFDSIDGRFQIYKVRPNTPAERAGLHVGDVLLAVDGTRITELTSGEEVALLLRGPIDQTVDITVRRANSELTLTVPRAAREQITARMLDNQVGYLKLPAFTAGVAADVRTALDELATQGMKSLVWDLRGNPGGSVRDAEAILNLFIDEGALFTVEMKQGEAETFVAQGSARWANLPMTVLIDGDSWSAAEISTAALLDHHRAFVLGAKSGGKGIIQDTIPLDSNSMLHLTIARWLSPNGHWIHKQGIQPEMALNDNPDTAADEVIEAAMSLSYTKSASLVMGR